MMFNDWAIHHLHLSTEKEQDDLFYKRSNNLAFVRFHKNIAYFIDILPHHEKNKYSNTNLLKIIRNNWQEIPMYGLDGRIEPNLSDAEYFSIRKKGYSTGVNIDNKGYFHVGSGYTSTGLNSDVLFLSDDVMIWCHRNKNLYKHYPSEFIKGLKQLLRMPI